MELPKRLSRQLMRLVLSAVPLASIAIAPAAVATPETAKSADFFVDSIGVNTHLTYTNTPYGSNYSNVKQQLVALGLRHIRDSGSSNDFIAKIKDLATLGIKTNYLLSPASGVAPNSSYWVNSPGYTINDFVKNKVGTNVIDSVEILNEIDLFYNSYRWHPNDTSNVNNDPNSPLYWLPYAESVTKDTWTALKNDPATAGVNVIGPSLGVTYDYNHRSPLDNLSSYVDFGNFHPYPGGGNSFNYPFSYDTINKYYWQSNFPAVNIDEYPFAFDIYAPPFGSKPMWATETGYHTSTAANSISEKIQGKYMPRIFLEYFRKGIARTFSYELLDEWNDSSNPEANYGLLHNDLSPKPAYTALKNLIGLLKDPGSSFTPSSLDYTLAFNPPPGYDRTQYVHHLLLQKQSGKFYLVLWHEIADSDISSTPMREIAPPAMPTTVTFNQAIGSATIYSLDDSGNMSSAPATISNNAFNLNVTDKVTIVEIAATPTQNLVQDGGFENQTSSTLSSPWVHNYSGLAGIDFHAGKAHTGDNNGWISNTTNSWANIQQVVSVQPNTDYTLTGYIRNSGNFGNNGYFGVWGSSGKFETTYGPSGDYTSGYMPVTVSFNSGNATSLTLYIGFFATNGFGWVQVDDVSLTPKS